MVDAHDSKSCTARCEGSSPSFGTIISSYKHMFLDMYYHWIGMMAWNASIGEFLWYWLLPEVFISILIACMVRLIRDKRLGPLNVFTKTMAKTFVVVFVLFSLLPILRFTTIIFGLWGCC